MKRKNAEEFVKIIQLLMSKDEESWILGITLFSETSFYKNLNKHAIFKIPCIYHTLGNLNATWDYGLGQAMKIRLKSYVQNLLKYPPKKTRGESTISIGVIGTILFKLLWCDNNRTRNSTIVRAVFYQSEEEEIDQSTKTKHKRNFRRRKNRKYTYDRELHYYEQALKSQILDCYGLLNINKNIVNSL